MFSVNTIVVTSDTYKAKYISQYKSRCARVIDQNDCFEDSARFVNENERSYLEEIVVHPYQNNDFNQFAILCDLDTENSSELSKLNNPLSYYQDALKRRLPNARACDYVIAINMNDAETCAVLIHKSNLEEYDANVEEHAIYYPDHKYVATRKDMRTNR